MAAGEVLLIGPQLDDGTGHASVGNLLDANALTIWNTFPTVIGWAGVDAGTPTLLTRVRLSPVGGFEDGVLNAILQGSVSASFIVPFQQGNAAHINGSGNATITCVFTGAQKAGNANVIFVAASAVSVTGVSDTFNGAYTNLASGNGISAWIKMGIAACGAGANTVTATFSPNASFPDIQVLEYTGISPNSTFDGGTTATGTGTAVNSGNITTTNAQDILIGYMAGGGSVTHTAGSGFTMRVDEGTGWNAATEDDGVTATGTYSASFTISSSQSWQCMIIALRCTLLSPVRYVTITNRAVPGILLNEYSIANGGFPYRYFRFLGAGTGSQTSLGDLDFIAQYTPGVIGQVVTPVITPPGGLYDLPTVVTISSLTTDAIFYYTTDGSGPTTASKPYTGPFVIRSSCTLKVVGVSQGLANSRIATALFTVPATFNSLDAMFDNRNSPIVSIDGEIFQDPVTSWWYRVAHNVDERGVLTSGDIGQNLYKSADLRNWIYVSTIIAPAPGQALVSGNQSGRNVIIYSATNGYVMWTQGTLTAFAGIYHVFTASSIEGTWTHSASYTGFNSVNGTGDMCIFLDSDGVSGYMSYTAGANAVFMKLNAAWTNWDGINFNSVSASGTFGIGAPFVNNQYDGPHMFKKGSTYFLVCSAQNGWAPTVNPYATASSPLGPWTNGGNPFVQVAGPGNGNPDYTLAYSSQGCYWINVPGRNLVIYTGDQYNTGLPGNVSTSTTANFQAWRQVRLPISFPTGTTMSITWNPSWSMDALFPTVSGGPVAPTGLSMFGNTFSWVNNDATPCVLYLDFATDSAFTQNTASEVIGTGTSSTLPTSYTRVYYTNPLKGYYRLRAVNANGSTPSAALIFFSPQSAGTSSGGMNQGSLIDMASYRITTSAGITGGTATFQDIGADGIARNLALPAPITLAANTTYQGTIGGLFHGLQLAITGLTGGTITYSEILTMTNQGVRLR